MYTVRKREQGLENGWSSDALTVTTYDYINNACLGG